MGYCKVGNDSETQELFKDMNDGAEFDLFMPEIGLQGKLKLFKEEVSSKGLEACFRTIDRILYKAWLREDIINIVKERRRL